MSQLMMIYNDKKLPPVNLPYGFTIEVHKGTKEQIDGWIIACEELNGRLWSHDEFLEKMIGDKRLMPERILYIADNDGNIAGSAAGLIDENNVGVLHMVGVAKAYRGKGLSKPVCAAVVETLLRAGVKEVILRTDESRIPAIKAYLSLGFKPYLFEDGMRDKWRMVLSSLGITDKDADAVII